MIRRYSHVKPKQKVIMAGAFPPPIHGMAAVNAAVRDILENANVHPVAIDVAAHSLDRSITARLGRVPRVVRGLLNLATQPGLRKATIYMSVSGGFGQVYEIAFILLIRLRAMRVILHHHSFAYLDRFSRLTRIMVRIAGKNAVHIALSPGMANQLSAVYYARNVIPISNTVFLSHTKRKPRFRKNLLSVGFIGNITAEKGIFEFLDLMEQISNNNLPLVGKLAGPFQDQKIEDIVRSRIGGLPSIQYVGPKYNTDKEEFYDSIDVLIFPTRYVNEAEPMTLHEAMSNAIPVISYGRGCIPEIVTPDCGLVIEPNQPFVSSAMHRLEQWLADPAEFQAASKAANERFENTHAENQGRWLTLLSTFICQNETLPTLPISVRGR